ncbi:MAG: hypothetical protein COB08_012160 [Rhodobacteraceae bacterium]|nr:hypothetical protein [Paracoccaceae bacterium]
MSEQYLITIAITEEWLNAGVLGIIIAVSILKGLDVWLALQQRAYVNAVKRFEENHPNDT